MSQIKTKFIEDDAVTDQKVKLRSTQYLRARNAADAADVNILRLNSLDTVEFPAIPQAIGTPAAANDLVNLAFLQSYTAGVRDPKDAVNAVSTGSNVALTGGTTLTIDGVTISNGMRLLLKDQTTGSQNGIYSVSGIGTAYSLAYASDFSVSADVTYGASTWTANGTANARTGWMLSTPDPIVLGTTVLTFVSIPLSSSYIGGDMIALTGSTFSVDLATLSGLSSTNPGNVAGQLQVAVPTPGTTATTGIDGSGNIKALRDAEEVFTLSGTDITNQYVDLAQVAHTGSVVVTPDGGIKQRSGTDFTLNYTGGSGSKTRVTFASDLGTGGNAALIAGDIIRLSYRYL